MKMVTRTRSIGFLMLFSLLCAFPLLAQGQPPQGEGQSTPLVESERDVEAAAALVETVKEVMAATNALDQAREQFVTATQLDPLNVEAQFWAGDLYLQTVERWNAAKYLLEAYKLDQDYSFDLLYKIGLGFQYGYQFSDAIVYYAAYREKLQANPTYAGNDKVALKDVERRIRECQVGRIYYQEAIEYSITSTGNRINSDFRDYAPVVNRDETVMIFTSRRRRGNLNENVDLDNIPFEDVFVSSKVNGQWTRAENIGEPINTKFHDSNLSLSIDGQTLYMYVDEDEGSIYESTRLSDTAWSKPTPIQGAAINSSFAEKSISISPDKELLFFSSNRPSTLGGLDLYVATKGTNGTWNRATNLGPVVNTEFDEEAPFLGADGKTLYFSTNGRTTMGGYDIYRTVFDSTTGQWSEPVNLGFPLNGPDDDVFFVAVGDGKRGYYASVKEDGRGYQDIYEVNLPDDYAERTEDIKRKVDQILEENPTIDDIIASVPRNEITVEDETVTEIAGMTPENNPGPGNNPGGDPGTGGDNPGDNSNPGGSNPGGNNPSGNNPAGTGNPAASDGNGDDNGTGSDNTGGDNSNPGGNNPTGGDDPGGNNNPGDTPGGTPTNPGGTNVGYPSRPVNEDDGQPTSGNNTGGNTSGDNANAIKPVLLQIKVTDKDTEDALNNVRIGLRRRQDNVVVTERRLGNGVYEFQIIGTEDTDYLLTLESPGYVFKNFTMRLPGASTEEVAPIRRKVELEVFKTGVNNVLRNIYFEIGRTSFTKESYFELNKLERMMRENPNLKVEIGGHTDNTGSRGLNKRLSQQRANAVKNYLVNKGIDARRMVARGYGEDKPLASNDDTFERELNRRVEFKILEQ